MKHYRKAAYAAVVGLVALVVTACGSSGGSTAASSTTPSGTTPSGSLPLKPGENPAGQNVYNGKRGGTLTVYSQEDFQHLDPGESYFSLDYAVIQANQRPLFSYPPNSSTVLEPNLATTVPTVANGGITDGGKTVTVHIQPDVKFNPPVSRVVTSCLLYTSPSPRDS